VTREGPDPGPFLLADQESPLLRRLALIVLPLAVFVAACGPTAPGDSTREQNIQLGHDLAAERGWTGAQWDCLYALWAEESGWWHYADNPRSDAYGIPQALPGSKMGAGWQYDAWVQIAWGLDYIAGRYGSPCGALSAKHRQGWY
jgi:hypothetical protein